MSNTYTQIHIQCVMAVKFRASLIDISWKEQLHRYITGIIQNHGHKMIAINSMPDHLHLLIWIQAKSINKQQFTPVVFRWQEGYGAFSYSRSHVQVVTDYVMNQEAHHRKRTFLEEYQQFLKQFEIEYDDRYIFKIPE